MNTKRHNLFLLIAIPVTAVLITAAAIIFKQSFLRIIPLYISLIVMALQSSVSRYAGLLGGINSIIYAAVYIYYRLYGAALQAVLLSFPMQILAFIHWGKNIENKVVKFRALTVKQRIFVILLLIVLQLILFNLLSLTDTKYAFLDSLMTLVGTLTLFLTYFPFIEYAFCNAFTSICSIILYIIMLKETPEQATYLIY